MTMNAGLQVFKFGGSSIKNAENIRKITPIIKQFGSKKLVIVVSAMGKGTNELERVVEAHQSQNGKALALWQAFKDRHYQLAKKLLDDDAPVFALLNDTFVAVDWILDDDPEANYDFIYDQIVSMGELGASIIVA